MLSSDDQPIKNLMRRGFGLLGLEVRSKLAIARNRAAMTRESTLAKWEFLARYRPDAVLDIGANSGQFARIAREILPQARILSFEPLEACFRELQATLTEIGNAEGFHFGLGETNCQLAMQRNEFTPSSSFLEVGEIHVRELPHTGQTAEESVEVRRLDDVLSNRFQNGERILLKIDVQGFEDRVIKGGSNVFSRSCAVVCETSSYEVYNGQAVFDEVYRLMKDLGLTFRGSIDQWCSKEDGRILQFDALFDRGDAVEGRSPRDHVKAEARV